jgi:hypothetical protein
MWALVKYVPRLQKGMAQGEPPATAGDYQSAATIGGRYGSLAISDDTVRLDARHW